MHSGILLLDKPEGPSSAQVVQKVKGLLGAKKIGHLGTLDPFASGLLLLGVNEGTKIAEIFLRAQKSYSGVIVLGVETDTQDFTGKVLQIREAPSLGEETIERLREKFTGTLFQTPPMFSALKRSGVRLYDLARQGKSVPREPREIKIENLKLWQIGPAELGFELTGSKGTYVRALAADMGEALGCGAHLKSLRRLACGHLAVEQAATLDALPELKARGEIPLLSLNRALGHLRGISLAGAAPAKLRQGQQDVLSDLSAPEGNEKILRLVDSENHLVALAEWTETGGVGRWRLARVFSS